MIILDYILDLLYPTKCCFCRRLTDGQKICRKCADKLPYTLDNSCQFKIPNISVAVSPLYYKDDVRESIHRYKFHSATGYSELYGKLISKCIDENSINCDIITWVPLSRKRRWRRGYNQAELIALEISKQLNMPAKALLQKIKDNPAQSGTGNAAKRKANVKGVYRAIETDFISGKTVLIVDDVITTGATISECASVLKACGCKDVFAASLARSKE